MKQISKRIIKNFKTLHSLSNLHTTHIPKSEIPHYKQKSPSLLSESFLFRHPFCRKLEKFFPIPAIMRCFIRPDVGYFDTKVFFIPFSILIHSGFFEWAFWIRIETFLDAVKLIYHSNINFMNIFIWILSNSKRSQLAQKYWFVDFRRPCGVFFWFWNRDIKNNSTETQREKHWTVIELSLLLIWKWMKKWTKCKTTNNLLIHFL